MGYGYMVKLVATGMVGHGSIFHYRLGWISVEDVERTKELSTRQFTDIMSTDSTRRIFGLYVA